MESTWAQVWDQLFGSQILDDKPQPTEKIKKEETLSEIRVTFNRPLTYSEREAFRLYFTGDADAPGVGDGYAVRFTDNDKVYITDFTEDDSRVLYDSVAKYVEKNFVNIHPVAVRTFTPDVKV